jgi:signal transduction histidine kinase
MRWRMRRPGRSLSAGLLLAATLALSGLALLVVGGAAAVTYVNSSFLGRNGLEETAAHVRRGLRFDAAGKPASVELPIPLKRIFDGLRSEVFYRVLDVQGRVILSSDGGDAPLTPQGERFDPARSLFTLPRGDTILHVLTLSVGTTEEPAFLQTARSERFNQAVFEIAGPVAQRSALATLAIALAVFSCVVFLIMRRTFHQLRRVGEAAAVIEPHNLSHRLSAQGVPTEVAPLVEEFNVVLDRLEKGFRLQQEFLATAAHELKTPITVMRAQLEVEGVANRHVLLKDLDQMARQVQQLLMLAEASEGQNYTMEDVDMAQIARSAIEQLVRLADARAVSLELDVAASSMVSADQGASFVLVRNLLENAIHHAPSGTRVRVEVQPGALVVRDAGPGIDPADLPQLFKRFWRGKHRRDQGAGLGLAICLEIATRHGWSIAAGNRDPGAEFAVTFSGAHGPG